MEIRFDKTDRQAMSKTS